MNKHYTNGEVTVLWQPKKCIHSGICAHGLSSVFKPREVPWIDMEGAGSDEIIDQVSKCPSGALSIVTNAEGSI
jgi:uncharacterized Fe-S cluster protein YjdI